jgi:hypothetical protein
MASPAAQTANRRLLFAPATKGNAPDLLAAPTVAGTVPYFNGSNIVWEKPGGATNLTAHLTMNGYPVWLFLDDPNTDMYGSWTPYEPGTYLICAIGGGGNGGSGTSSGPNSYAGGEGGCGGIAVSRVTISSADLAELTAWKRRFLRWRTTTGNVTYVYLSDPNPSFGLLGVTTMQANKGSNGGGTTSTGVGAGGAGGTASGGNVANLQGAGGVGGLRYVNNYSYGNQGSGSLLTSGSYNQYFSARREPIATDWNRFRGIYFHHATTGVSMPQISFPNSWGGNFGICLNAGMGGGGGAYDGYTDRNQGYGGPGGVVIIKES